MMRYVMTNAVLPLGLLSALPLVTCMLLAPRVAAESLTLVDLTAADAGQRWRAINDTVMGGRSRGEPRIVDGALVFSGEISLENQGGFSSTRAYDSVPRQLEGYAGIELLVKGDGRAYFVTLNTSARRWFTEVYYWAKIQPERDVWSVVRIPFERFEPMIHGRKLSGPPLDLSDLRSIGLMLYDKQAGPFRIAVAEWRAYRADAAPAPTADLVGTALAAGSFKTLIAAVQAAGLVDALRVRGPLTILAPTDEAFAALPQGALQRLLEPSQREHLVAILKLHLIAGSVTQEQALAAGEAASLAGMGLRFVRRDGDVTVNGARIVKADLRCSNGVIHVIDRVLLPTPPATAQPATAARRSMSERKAVSAADARTLITLAIERGVPLFNDGQAGACLAIYEVAIVALLQGGSLQAHPELLEAMRTALQHSRNDSAHDGAWRLRRALDAAYAALTEMTR
jgi:uncharacterized surface protein with fasciclin (FAS1) repeats